MREFELFGSEVPRRHAPKAFDGFLDGLILRGEPMARGRTESL